MRWVLALAAPQAAPAPPWDDPAAVRRHLVETLPGTTFDADGVGRFVRRTYTVTFRMAAGDPSVIEVDATDATAESALLRVAQRAGWQLLDFETGRPVTTAGEAPAAPPREVIFVEESGWARAAKAAGLVLFLAAGVWWSLSWQEATKPIVIDTPDPAGAVPVAGAGRAPAPARGLLDPTLRSADGVALPPEAVAGLRDELQRRADAFGRRMSRLKTLAPRFRDDVVANEMLDYIDGSRAFVERWAASRYWVAPETLATLPPDYGPLPEMRGPLLPPAFAQRERHGYRFTFDGEQCGNETPDRIHLRDLPWQVCRGGVYVAVPIDAGKPSFAFYTRDMRVHYRNDGERPGLDAPTVANTDPSSADELPTTLGVAEPDDPNARGLFRTFNAMLDRAFGEGGRVGAIVEAHERQASADLRAFQAAQIAYSASMGIGLYTSLERLMDPNVTEGAPPFLPEYFAQPLRQGYRFSFVGTPLPGDRGRRGDPGTGPGYAAYAYVAMPEGAVPAGRRALAIYPDGVIHVTSDGRTPTERDPAITAGR